jgi:hypothetical protein
VTEPAQTGTLLMRVDDLDRAAAQYTALGLRTVSRTRALLVIELPCGAHLILFRPWGGVRACA